MTSSTEMTKVSPEVLERFGQLGRELSTMTVLFHSRIAEQMGLSGTDHRRPDRAALRPVHRRGDRCDRPPRTARLRPAGA
jgi:hypothetical protein